MTRLSPECCEQMVEGHALPVIFKLIKSCNRSVPHMELVKYSISVLLNVVKVCALVLVYQIQGRGGGPTEQIAFHSCAADIAISE